MTGLTNSLPIKMALVLAPPGSARETDYMIGFGKFGDTRLSYAQNRVTHDARRYSFTDLWFAADPRLRLGGPTYAWLRAGLQSIELMADDRYFQAIKTPVLLLSAGQDLLVDSPSHVRICAALPNCTLVQLPQSKHEIMMERDDIRAIFWAEFDRFSGALSGR